MKRDKSIYDYVENIFHILPRGAEDSIINAILQAFEAEEDLEEVVAELEEKYGKTIDFDAIVQTIIVGLDNIDTLQSILNEYGDEHERLYVIGQTPVKEQCEWCRENVEGKIFCLIKNPDREPEKDQIDDPVFGTISMIWPQKTLNPTKRWVRADFQHVYCRCSFAFFDPLINVYNKKTQQLEVMLECNDMPAYMKKAYLCILNKQLECEKEALKDTDSEQEKENHKKIMNELNNNINILKKNFREKE